MLHILSTLNLSKVAHCDYGNAWLKNSAYLAYLTISAWISSQSLSSTMRIRMHERANVKLSHDYECVCLVYTYKCFSFKLSKS